ncbi:MAG: DNA polymerase III subunit alpha [Planctomycetaceae bacterium]|nr:DNA polymerase III subunit alpha [Planctomycetaceae bacterium]
MRAAALLCRSYFSLLRGAVAPDRWAKAAKELGYGALAMADTNNLYGIKDFFNAAKEAGIKPIVGAEVLTSSQRAFFMVENEQGYRNLCRIITACNLDTEFCLLKELSVSAEGLICICFQKDLSIQLKSLLPQEALFFGCTSEADAEWSMANRVEPVAADTYTIIDKEDVVAGRILNRIRELGVEGPGPADGCGFVPLPPEAQLKERFRRSPRAVTNSLQIESRCEFELFTGRCWLPKIQIEKDRSGDDRLARICHKAIAGRYRPLTQLILKRLEHELNVIKGNGFSDYFLLVNEIVSFAKSRNIPVEIRGSAAGSLVSHVLGFTRVCPLEYDLYFERFMNPGRKDCPDIDIDLCWRGRDEVIQFCYEHWGHDHVAMISTMNTYRLKGAIRDVGRFLALPPHQVDEYVRKRRTPDESIIYKLARKITGMPRHVGIHCGGIVITPCPVGELAPLQYTNKGVIVTQYEKDTAEAVGLVKIDLLGNRALSTVNEAVKLVNQNQSEPLDIDAVSRTDAKIGRLLTHGKTMGVFQCESPGMSQLCRGLKVKSQKDVMIALSLIRPGPASGGMKKEFIERCLNGKPFKYLHPRLEKMLKDTYGLLLYQEDVMKIAVEVAGYTLAEANQFRTDVSKHVSSIKLHQQYTNFVYHKANQAGIDKETAETIWEQVLKFAAYSYCKAHATVYANIAWQTAYLKTHHPREFYISLFNNHHGMYPLRVYVWDAIRSGVRVLPPHVNYSLPEWSKEGTAIRAGLGIVSGLTCKTMRAIVEQRQQKPFTDLNDFRSRVKCSRPEIENLVHLGACDGLGQTRPLMFMQLRSSPVQAGQMLLFDLYKNPSQRLLDYDRLARLRAEIEITGIGFSVHPAVYLDTEHVLAAELYKFINSQVTVAGFVATARTEDGRMMGFATIEDASGLAELSFFPDRIDDYYRVSAAAGAVWARGVVNEHLASISIDCRCCGGLKMPA